MEFFIVDTTADTMEPIAVFDSRETACDSLKYFCSVLPMGWLEVMDLEEFIIAVGK